MTLPKKGFTAEVGLGAELPGCPLANTPAPTKASVATKACAPTRLRTRFCARFTVTILSDESTGWRDSGRMSKSRGKAAASRLNCDGLALARCSIETAIAPISVWWEVAGASEINRSRSTRRLNRIGSGLGKPRPVTGHDFSRAPNATPQSWLLPEFSRSLPSPCQPSHVPLPIAGRCCKQGLKPTEFLFPHLRPLRQAHGRPLNSRPCYKRLNWILWEVLFSSLQERSWMRLLCPQLR